MRRDCDERWRDGSRAWTGSPLGAPTTPAPRTPAMGLMGSPPARRKDEARARRFPQRAMFPPPPGPRPPRRPPRRIRPAQRPARRSWRRGRAGDAVGDPAQPASRRRPTDPMRHVACSRSSARSPVDGPVSRRAVAGRVSRDHPSGGRLRGVVFRMRFSRAPFRCVPAQGRSVPPPRRGCRFRDQGASKSTLPGRVSHGSPDASGSAAFRRTPCARSRVRDRAGCCGDRPLGAGRAGRGLSRRRRGVGGRLDRRRRSGRDVAPP